jgi:hypothetical protein
MPDEFTELNRANINQALASAKKYIDDRVTAGLVYYFTNTASDVGGYKKMIDTYDGAAKVTFTNTDAVDDEAIEEFVTEPGEPGVTFLDEGVYDVHLHAKNTQIGSKDASIYYELYKRTVAPAETLIATSNSTPALTSTETEYSLHCSHIAVELGATDRLVIKLIISVSGAGAAPDVLTYIQGTGADVTASRLTMPSVSQIVANKADLDDMEAHLMIGSANAAHVPCIVAGGYSNNTYWTYGTRIRNSGANDFSLTLQVPLPTNRGGLKLYLTNIQWNQEDADANDYVSQIDLRGQLTTVTSLESDNNGGAGWTGTGQQTFTFGAARDCSGYRAIQVELTIIATTTNELDINYVTVSAYYDT